MPAVGSYKGCNACYMWKKKCKGGNPCVRCKEREMECIGVGMQRFKWKQGLKLPKGAVSPLRSSETNIDFQFEPSGYEDILTHSPPGTPRESSQEVQQQSPREGRVQQPTPPPDVSYNPDHKYHWMILLDIPRYSSSPAALDAAVEAFQRLLEHVRSPSSDSQGRCFRSYSRACELLNASLGDNDGLDKDTAYASKLLVHCNNWWNDGESRMRGYGEGLEALMRILRLQDSPESQQCHDPRDEIVDRAVNAMATDVLVDSMVNSDVELFPWIQNVAKFSPPQNLLSPNCQLYHFCFGLKVYAGIPQLMRQPRQNIETIESYYTLSLDEYRHKDSTVAHPINTPLRTAWPTFKERTCHRESQALRTAVSIMLNSFLRKLQPSSEHDLEKQSTLLCVDAILLAENASGEAPWPWSAQFIPHSTFAAWCVSDGWMKYRLRELLEFHRTTSPMWRFLEEAQYWKEAPSKLAQEIDWFPAYRPRPQAQQGRNAKQVHEPMDDYCCVM
ncbi:hypothetical protein QQS21_002137 [Conoideocrella luteorostrata]|uniref:Zn(2)-C6 fungal-type domain-containing protein n=1 Tax=Conoideocrella luteorostrata TaxID=1105319 RepID=A0AAJ0CVS5_9HYPO|nr:hypothetical protein QQS21_002137 [Conoideocrella luteorostrata]